MLALVLFAAMLAPEFSADRPSDRARLHSALSNMAEFCVRDYGFTRLPLRADGTDKLYAELLLAGPSRQSQIIAILNRGHSIENAAKDEGLLDRIADAQIAAAADPEAYERAEALYLRMMMGPALEALQACRDGATDPFIARHYWTGTGSADRYVPILKQMFAEDVAETKAAKEISIPAN